VVGHDGDHCRHDQHRRRVHGVAGSAAVRWRRPAPPCRRCWPSQSGGIAAGSSDQHIAHPPSENGPSISPAPPALIPMRVRHCDRRADGQRPPAINAKLALHQRPIKLKRRPATTKAIATMAMRVPGPRRSAQRRQHMPLALPLRPRTANPSPGSADELRRAPAAGFVCRLRGQPLARTRRRWLEGLPMGSSPASRKARPGAGLRPNVNCCAARPRRPVPPSSA
jgi:hypothetical protein